MRLFGRLIKFILNINTIWGLMILIAFALGAYKQYTPIATAIPAELLVEGENVLTIRLVARNKEVRDYTYTLEKRAGEFRIREDDQASNGERPWLISAAIVGDSASLEWDCSTYGSYDLAVGNRIVESDKLVTLQSLTDAAFHYAKIGFDIALGLVAAMVLFLGLMKVGEAAGIVQLVARLFYPIMRFLFPEVPKDHPANGAILMNWTTTLLGLGNAATPFGLKAMKELQSLNPHKNVASDSQVMLLGYNTAGLALLPTTLLAVRKSAGCADPFEVIGTCMFAGLAAMITAIVMVKVLGKLPFFSVQAALAEEANETSASVGEG